MLRNRIIALMIFCMGGKAYTQPLPLDDKLRYGKLPNGFTYYIRHTDIEKGKATVKLTVKAGVMHEEPDQLELAHLLEHLGMAKTKHFPDFKVYLAAQGIVPGRESNAFTGTNTTYWVKVKTDPLKQFYDWLLWARDVAQGGISIDDTLVDKQRGIVASEINGNRIPEKNVRQMYMKMLLSGSKYIEREFTDTRQNLKTFHLASLERFYKDWYRPDMEAIIVVGDINTDSVEQHIKQLFSDMAMPVFPKMLQKDDHVVFSGNSKVTVIADPASSPEFRVAVKKPYLLPKTRKDYQLILTRELAKTMLNARIKQLNEATTPFFTSATFNYEHEFGNPVNPVSAFLLNIGPGKGMEEKAFSQVMTEVERLRRFGFTARELEIGRKSMLEEFNRSWQGNRSFIADYESNFLSGTPAMGAEKFLELKKQLIEQISLSHVNAAGKTWSATVDRDIFILGADKALLTEERTIDSVLSALQYARLTPYVLEETNLTQPLMSKEKVSRLAKLSAGKITEKKYEKINVSEWVLSNGLRVLLKPTKEDPYNSGIQINCIKPGGTNEYPDADYVAATLASQVIKNSGIGPYNGASLKKYLKQNEIAAWAVITENYAVIKGTSQKARGLEAMLQGIYLLFTETRKDDAALAKLVAEKKIDVAERGKREDITPRNRLLTPENLDKVNLEQVYKLYIDNFGAPNEFVYIITGVFDPAAIKPLLTKYLAALPVSGPRFRMVGNYNPYTPVKKTDTTIYYKNGSEQAKINFIFKGLHPFSVADAFGSEVLGEVLRMVMWDRLRTKEGLSYVTGGIGNLTDLYGGIYYYQASADCAPINLTRAVTCVKEEINSLKLSGLTPELLTKARAVVTASLNQRMKSASEWQEYLFRQVRSEKDLNEIAQYPALIESITPEMIRGLASKHFADSMRVIEISMHESNRKIADTLAQRKLLWHHLDITEDKIYGISLNKTYNELLHNKKADTVIVAVLDNGIDTLQEDLSSILWKNKNEMGNDEDGNGYKGDSHGWNFLGNKDGKNLMKSGYEYQRWYFQLRNKYGNTRKRRVSKKQKQEHAIWLQLQQKVTTDSLSKISSNIAYINSIGTADSLLQKNLERSEYSFKDLKDWKPKQKEVQRAFYQIAPHLRQYPDLTNRQCLELINKTYTENLYKPLVNPMLERQKIISDKYDDLNDALYGNNDLTCKHSCSHGTHVAGNIAAVRNNDKGMDGISNAVKLMALRVVPAEGNEYDKDVALAIRYAVDNGAKVINMSFAKAYSPERTWVEDAIKYAAAKDVLIVNGAGNDGKNIDSFMMYPTAKFINGKEKAPNMITVGASGEKMEKLVAGFSNYGQSVDVFAPGVKINSTLPSNMYSEMSGTSMASPVVAGIACLLRSYFPQFTATEIKYIIESSVVKIDLPVARPGSKELVSMESLCRTGGIVNAYNAVLLAQQLANKK